ncbi:MAG: hypothetical protein AAGM22_24385 [Acidobacteriota bacterium]
MRSRSLPLVIFTAVLALVLFTSPAFGLSNGGACVAECTHPYETMLYLTSVVTPMTALEAVEVCRAQYDALGSWWDARGFTIRWVNQTAPAPDETGRFTCFACINAVFPITYGNEVLTDRDSIRLETAVAITAGTVGGQVVGADRLLKVDPEMGLYATSFQLKVEDSEELGGAGMVGVDPFDGQVTAWHPVRCEER